MSRERVLKVILAGDADQLDREARRASGSLDKLGKQTKLTASISSKGYSAMKVGATGAAAGLAGLAIAGKRVVDAAVESEKSQAALAAQLKASGISYQAHAKDIDAVIRKHSQLAGVDDEELQDAFTALVRSTGSVGVAMKDMGVVTDLARARNIDVAKAATLVAKVHAGGVAPLKAMGIEFVKTTTNVDKLKAAHDKITPAQLAAAKAADKQANSQRALGLLQDAVKGQAEAYGKTTAGAMDRAKVAIEGVEETIGGALAPTVEKAANKLADFVNEMQSGTGQGGRFVDKLKDVWQETKPVVLWTGRAAKNVAQFTEDHPGLAKLVAGIVAVGGAVKVLKFVSAVTGFSSLLKAGGVAAKGLKSILGRAGTSAGTAAAENAAAGMAAQGRFKSAGSKAGKAYGGALRLGAVVGLAGIGAEVTRTVKSELTKAGLWNPPGGRGSFWDNLLPEKLLPDLKLDGPGGQWLKGLLDKKPKDGLLQRAMGGVVPGSGSGDTVPAMLTPGEFVIRKQVVERFGPTFFAGLNGGNGTGGQRFALGGKVAGLNPGFQSALRGLSSATGIDINVTSGRRSFAEQTRLWNASDKTGKWVARPGTSKHESGNAADIAPQRGAFPGSSVATAGLHFPMSWEPWHIEMLGGGGARAVRTSGRATSARAVTRKRRPAPPGLRTPRMVDPYAQNLADFDVAGALAESTSGTTDDVRALEGRRAAVQGRLNTVTGALRRKLRPATRLRLTEERGQLIGELNSINGSLTDLQTPAEVDAGTGEDPNQALIDAINAKADQDAQLAAEQAARDQDIRRATEEQAAAQRALQASLDANTAFADRVSAVTSIQAIRVVSDVLTGQLGHRVGARALLPGSGELSRL